MTTYGLADVRRLTGATRAQMIHWTTTKVVRAQTPRTEGTGHPRLFSGDELAAIRVAVELANQFKIPVSTLRLVLILVRNALRRQDELFWVTFVRVDPRHPHKTMRGWSGTYWQFAPHLLSSRSTGEDNMLTGLLVDLVAIRAELRQAGATW
jgi:hypothetical protein